MLLAFYVHLPKEIIQRQLITVHAPDSRLIKATMSQGWVDLLQESLRDDVKCLLCEYNLPLDTCKGFIVPGASLKHESSLLW